MRVALGDGREAWGTTRGSGAGAVAAGGDPAIRDRDGQWTYGFSVVVDDLRQGIDLVVRGLDLLDATADQIRLARLLGREMPPAFAHHPLVRRPDGTKLSKADGATGVRDLRARGATASDLIAERPSDRVRQTDRLAARPLGRQAGSDRSSIFQA